MKIIFVHGWSVRHTETYGDLPRWLAEQRGPDGQSFKVENVFLGNTVAPSAISPKPSGEPVP